MSPASNLIPTIAAALLCANAVAQPTSEAEPEISSTSGSPVEQYLVERGMDDLLAQYLVDLLDAERGNGPRQRIASRLATVYARLIEASSDEAERQHWIDQARPILSIAASREALGLRLSFAQASYRALERDAENILLGVPSEVDREMAISRFDEVLTEIDAIVDAANDAVRSLERKEESPSVADRTQLAEELTSAREHRSLAEYLAGWCNLYLAIFDSPADHAEPALVHFGTVLNAPPGEAALPERVALANTTYDHIARSAIATARAYSLQGRSAPAIQILADLDRRRNLPRGMPELIIATRIDIAIDERRYREALTILTESADQPLGVGTLRKLVLRAIGLMPDATSTERLALDLLRDAGYAQLVASNELGHALELLALDTQRTTSNGQSFVSSQLAGLQAYGDARELHELEANPDSPASSSSAVDRYLAALSSFESALAAPDADTYPQAAARTRFLSAICLFYASKGEPERLLSALEQFEAAATSLTDERAAADALWMAARCAYTLVREGSSNTDRPLALFDRFLQTYPNDDRVGRITLMRAEFSGSTLEQRIEDLLAVEQSSPQFDAAQRQAAQLLHEAYRAAPASERQRLGERYARIAEPLLADEIRRLYAGEGIAYPIALSRARRLAEILLASSAPDLSRAQRIVASLELLVDHPLAAADDRDTLLGEVLFRKLQIAVAANETADQDRLLAELDVASPQIRDSAQLLVTLAAARAWANQQDPALRLNNARRFTSIAIAFIERRHPAILAAPPPTDADTASDWTPPEIGELNLWLQTAEALVELPASAEADAIALRLLRWVLRAQPDSPRALRALAMVGDRLADHETALDAWRRLIAGLAPGSADWFEAKANQIRLLLIVDPPRATSVFNQLKTLYPSLGPEPFATQLRALGEEIDRESAP